MNEVEFKTKIEMIKDNFNDTRKIKCPLPKHFIQIDDGVHKGGDFFSTHDGEIIDLEFQLVDFDEEELAKYIELAENIYEKHHKHVSIYLICPKTVDVTVKECTIKSESDFTIKLYCSQLDPCEIILTGIKNKIFNNEILSEEDLLAVEMLPVMCAKKDRNYFRVESLKITNRFSC